MEELNCITLETFPMIQFYGFAHLGDFAFVTIAQSTDAIVIESQELPEQDNRFRIGLSPERMVTSERFYHLAEHYRLENTRFIYNPALKNYVPTRIPI